MKQQTVPQEMKILGAFILQGLFPKCAVIYLNMGYTPAAAFIGTSPSDIQATRYQPCKAGKIC